MILHVYEFLEKTLVRFRDKRALIEVLPRGARREITYENFDSACKKLASELLRTSKSGAVQDPILIILPKSIDCLIAFFAVALSGNFYTLLDEKSPKLRIRGVIEILKPKILITSKTLKFDLNITTLYIEDFEEFLIDERLIHEARAKHIDTNLLYVFFTSGSTGSPKGVSISHRSVIDYTFWVCKSFKLDEHASLANQAPFYFDNSILDIFSSIKLGASLHILPNHLFAFPNEILRYLEQERITTIFWVPSVLIYFANTHALDSVNLDSLKNILFCGETMPNKQLNIWRKKLPKSLFANLYGPTEITDVCCFYIVNRNFSDEELLPIGKACKNVQLLVFDEDLQLINPEQVGKKGELFVRGTCLSLGYFNDKERTKLAFIQNPLHDHYLDLVYKTGDIVAYNEFGELLCYGRRDNQIKYMGHRIELEEIESIINSHPKIKNSICIFKLRIICFYEAHEEVDLRSFASEHLHPYMVPSQFIRVDSFSYNQNGKIDRKVLHEL